MASGRKVITVVLKPGLARLNTSAADETSHHIIGHSMNYRLNSKPHSWRPPADIYETEEKIIVLVEIAGMQEEDFLISVDRNILTIAGLRPSPLSEKKAIHQLEIPFGEFSTEIEYAFNIDTDSIEATYHNGFLRIDLKKSRPKPIQINKD